MKSVHAALPWLIGLALLALVTAFITRGDGKATPRSLSEAKPSRPAVERESDEGDGRRHQAKRFERTPTDNRASIQPRPKGATDDLSPASQSHAAAAAVNSPRLDPTNATKDTPALGFPRGKTLPKGGMVTALREQVADEDLSLLAHLGARMARPAPHIAFRLLAMKRSGATHADLLRFVREKFPPNLRLKAETVAWLEQQRGLTPPQPSRDMPKADRERLRKALARTGRPLGR